MGLLAWLVQLVKNGQLSQDHANLWTAVVLAVFSPALASIFAPNGLRTYLFLVAGALQGLLVGFGAWSNNALGTLGIALLGALATSSLAAANVNKAVPHPVTPPQ
jgi:Na+/H+ antiporter NhaB